MGLLRSLFLVALMLGGLAMTGYGWTMYQNEQSDVQQAVETTGTVTGTDVEQIGSPDTDGSVKFEPVVRYTYTYDGQEYSSGSVYPGPEKRFGLKEDAEAVTNQFSPDQTVTVYVNQKSPARAFLINETGGTLLPYLLMGIGAVLALSMGSSLGKEVLGRGSEG